MAAPVAQESGAGAVLGNSWLLPFVCSWKLNFETKPWWPGMDAATTSISILSYGAMAPRRNDHTSLSSRFSTPEKQQRWSAMTYSAAAVLHWPGS